MKITRQAFLALLAAAARGFSKPRRMAMAIDLAKCWKDRGCTRCAQACHAAHNVPRIPDRRHEIKWIWKERFENAFGQESAGPAVAGAPVPVLCNHCEHPACVQVCPTGATFKRESDGLVMMDEHRCIGCRYCMAACPYGARSFNWSDPRPFLRTIDPAYPTREKGVVEKCTFCNERLARGGQPACVEVCPFKAMVFGDAADPSSAVAQLLQARHAFRRKPELGAGANVFYIL
jgi:molybdopterin-containing oxidoreductase family iron-sulfur binding subunit